MSLKSRLQKNRLSKTSANADIDVDLIEFFEEHKDFDNITIYSHDKIFSEKQGTLTAIEPIFSSEATYRNEIYRIAELYEKVPDFENPCSKISISDDINMEILIYPIVSEGVFTVISRKNKKEEKSVAKSVSNEIFTYLSEGMKQKLNIFVIGSADTDKAGIIRLLLNLCDSNNKIVISDKTNSFNPDNPYCLKVNDFYSYISDISFDNLFVNDTNTKELINIFELIISGYKGFVVSLSLKDKTDILEAIRNKILLSNPNLFDENADFMSGSSIDVILTLGNDNYGNTRILKVSEIFENNSKEYSIKDLFCLNENGEYISVGNRSRFFNKTNSPTSFSEEYFKKEYVHSFRQEDVFDIEEQKQEFTEPEVVSEFEENQEEQTTEMTETEPISDVIEIQSEEIDMPEQSSNEDIAIEPSQKSEFARILDSTEIELQKEKEENSVIEEEVQKAEEPVSKLDKLKSKLKNNKKRKEKAETLHFAEFVQTQEPEFEEKTLNVTETFTTNEIKEVGKQDTNNIINAPINILEPIEAKDEIISEEPASMVIQEESVPIAPKKRRGRKPKNVSTNEGVLASETDDFQMYGIPTPTYEETSDIIEESEESEEENKVNITEEYAEYYNNEEIIEEPELFSEIKDVDVNNEEYDFNDIQDESI